MAVIDIGSTSLKVDDIVAVARDSHPVGLSNTVGDKMRASRVWVEDMVSEDSHDKKPIYSINTGFGSLAGKSAFSRASDAVELSRRLIISNAAGLGDYLDEEVVRAAMVIRLASLTKGYSGVRKELVDVLVEMLNRGVTPAVPEYGSLGASGDLAPLAHVALVASRAATGSEDLADSGEAFFEGELLSGREAMSRAGIQRIVLGAKEGLALLNGTSFSAALVALAVKDASDLVEASEVVAAMTIEALSGFGDAFIRQIHEARGQVGQIASAEHMRLLLSDSRLIDGSESVDPARQPPQDAYSLRCIPQVLGAVRDTITFAHQIVEREINAVTDNPLIFLDLPESRELKAVSGGNFHAEYLGFVADFMSIAVTELGSIAERRMFRLDDGTLNRGLADMLIDSEIPGIDCGYMLPQYVAAGLVSDSKTLAHPDSVDSIPTSANQEDHVSMAMNAGRHLRQIVWNAQSVIGIELLMAAQALDLRLESLGESPEALAKTSRTVLELVRSTKIGDDQTITFHNQDVVMYPRIRAATDLIRSGAVLRAARTVGAKGAGFDRDKQ